MTARLAGKVALVTGGGSGLGRALVDRFLAEGCAIGVLEKSPKRCDELTRTHDGITVVCGDAADLDANVDLTDALVATHGRLDVTIANTGIWDYCEPLLSLPTDDRLSTAFDELFAVNVKAYLMAARATAKPLLETRGVMIFTVSPAGQHPGGGGPLYTASKHAVVGLVRQLAYELAPDVRVNGVAPGAIHSNIRGPAALEMAGRAMDPAAVKVLMRELSPLQTVPDAADYTGTYVFLADARDSRAITGEVIAADGGERVRGRRASELARQAAATEAGR